MKLLGALVLCSIIATGVSVSHTCYYCQNHNPQSGWYYDENCGAADYDGHRSICHDGCDVCYVHTYHEEGRVERGSAAGHIGEDCSDHGGKSHCYCEGDLCNSYLCSDPDACKTTVPPTPSVTTPKTTPETITTTEAVTTVPTDPTTQPITTTETITTEPTDPTTYTTQHITTITTEPTAYTTQHITTTETITTEPTDPTTPTPQPITTTETITTEPTDPTTITTQTTTTPTTTPPSIECFDCQMSEPDWDNYDANCNAPDYAGITYRCVNCHSCYTQVLADGTVVRGEAGSFQDGQCLYGTNEQLGLDYVDCYCNVDLCNISLCEDCTD